jgi:hypothetical protein
MSVDGIDDLEIGKVAPGDYWVEGYRVRREQPRRKSRGRQVAPVWCVRDAGHQVGPAHETFTNAKRWIVDHLNEPSVGATPPAPETQT